MKRVAQAVAVLAVGVAVAIWGISKTFMPGTVTRLERADPTQVDAAPPAATTLVDPRRSPLTAEKPAAPSPSPSSRAANAVRAPVVVVPPRSASAQVPTRAPGSVVPVAPIGRSTASAPRDAALPPPQLRFETFKEVVDSSIYSASDPGVEPPIVLYPQQLGRVPAGLRRDEISFVEVIINEEGKVLQVKARESPATLDESMVLTMSLSAAKSWRFQPAQKDGHPVKYRHVLPVSLR